MSERRSFSTKLPTLVRRASSSVGQEFGLLMAVIVIAGGLSIYGGIVGHPRHANAFLNLPNLVNGVLEPMSVFGIMAVGMTMVIITGGIDLSVGAVYAAGAMCAAWVLQTYPVDADPATVLPMAALICLGVGLACGLFNGLLIVLLRLHPFIVTLGTMSIIRGLVIVLPPAQSLPEQGGRLPTAITEDLMQARIPQDWIPELLGVSIPLRPVPILFMLGAIIYGWVYLRHTVAGRETYAIGGNEEAARFSGIRTGMGKVRVYALAGLMAGLASLVHIGQYGAAASNTGLTYELTVIAAAVVGGASLSGGRGTALGALLGALILQLVNNGIDITRINQEYNMVIVGAAVIVAVSIDRLTSHWRGRSAPV